MKLRIVALAMAWSSLVEAAPAVKPPLCAPDDLVHAGLFAAGGKPIVCWQEPDAGCVEAAVTLAAVAHPAAATTNRPELRANASRLEACLGSTCKTLGPKLTAAIAKARSANAALPAYLRNGSLTIEVTFDLAMVSIRDTSGTASQDDGLWSIGRDALITPKPPASLRGRGPYLTFGTQVVGTAVIMVWSVENGQGLRCGENGCIVRTIVDEGGRNHGELWGAGTAFEYERQRFITVDTIGTVSVISAKTGAVLGSLQIDDGLIASGVVVLRDDEIAVLASHGATPFLLVRLRVTGNQPTLLDRREFDACAP